MSPSLFGIGLAAIAATLSGGAIAIRFHSRLSSLLGFSSGVVIAVAVLDLLPEAIELGQPHASLLTLATAVAAGFVVYLIVDWLLADRGGRPRGHRRYMGPASLTVHSVLDGFSIGLTFQVAPTVGFVVAWAVLAHDLLDGANTVSLSFAGGVEMPAARRWLLADAVAPLVGIAVAQAVSISATDLALLLALFAGGFLYIGASELLPRSRAQADTFAQVGSVGLGMGLVYAVVALSTT